MHDDDRAAGTRRRAARRRSRRRSPPRCELASAPQGIRRRSAPARRSASRSSSARRRPAAGSCGCRRRCGRRRSRARTPARRAAVRVDVLDAHPRDERAADRERAVLDVDALVRPMSQRQRAQRSRGTTVTCRPSADERNRAAQRRAPSTLPATTSTGDRHDAPERELLQRARPGARRGEPAGRLGVTACAPARRRAARTREPELGLEDERQRDDLGASVARRSRRRCARCACARSYELQRGAHAPARPSRASRAQLVTSAAEKRSGHIALITIASSPSRPPSRSRRSSSIVSLTGISSGSATAT